MRAQVPPSAEPQGGGLPPGPLCRSGTGGLFAADFDGVDQ